MQKEELANNELVLMGDLLRTPNVAIGFASSLFTIWMRDIGKDRVRGSVFGVWKVTQCPPWLSFQSWCFYLALVFNAFAFIRGSMIGIEDNNSVLPRLRRTRKQASFPAPAHS